MCRPNMPKQRLRQLQAYHFGRRKRQSKWSRLIGNEAMKTSHKTGFTLIELMIVVVVLGVIAAIAFPSYNSQVQKTRRADATSALLNEAQRLERCFTRFSAYTSCPAPSGTTEGGFYTLSAPIFDTAEFEVHATPVAGTSQANDPCATFTLTHTGARGRTGTATRCWGTP